MKLDNNRLEFYQYELKLFQERNIPVGLARELFAVIKTHITAPALKKRKPEECYFGFSNEDLADFFGVSIKAIEKVFKILYDADMLTKTLHRKSIVTNEGRKVVTERHVFINWSIYEMEDSTDHKESEIEKLKNELAEIQKTNQELISELATLNARSLDFGFSDLRPHHVKVIKKGTIPEQIYYADGWEFNALFNQLLGSVCPSWYDSALEYFRDRPDGRVYEYLPYIRKSVNDSIKKHKMFCRHCGGRY